MKQRSVTGQDLSGLSLEECEALVPHGPGGWRKIREETQTNLAAILFIYGVERCWSLEIIYMLETSEYMYMEKDNSEEHSTESNKACLLSLVV